MGFEVLGDNDSPVMPIMLYNPAKIPAFSRECLRQKVSSRVCQNILKIQIALCFWYTFKKILCLRIVVLIEICM